MAILALMAIMAIRSPLFLIHNMHVHCRGMTQEALNGIKVKVLLPPPDGGSAKDNLCDFVFAGECAYSLGNVFFLEADDARAHIFGKAYVGGQRTLFFF